MRVLLVSLALVLLSSTARADCDFAAMQRCNDATTQCMANTPNRCSCAPQSYRCLVNCYCSNTPPPTSAQLNQLANICNAALATYNCAGASTCQPMTCTQAATSEGSMLVSSTLSNLAFGVACLGVAHVVLLTFLL